MKNKTKSGHFVFWLKGYLLTLFLPRLGLKKGYKREWMTWGQYKAMTGGLSRKLYLAE